MTTFASHDLVLAVENARGAESTPTVKVGWCVSKRLAEHLIKVGARDVHVLLVVAQDDNTTYQQHVTAPIGPGMTYVGLRHAGRNTIHATIVWRQDGEDSPDRILRETDAVFRYYSPRQNLLRQRRQQLEEQLAPGPVNSLRGEEIKRRIAELSIQMEAAALDQELTTASGISKVQILDIKSSIDVVVPDHVFAEPPKGIYKWLIEYGSNGTRVDQCDARRKAILGVAKILGIALTFPIWGLVWLLWKLVGLLVIVFGGLFFGLRGIDYAEVFSWRWQGNILKHTTNSFYFADSNGKRRSWPWFVLNPPVVTAVALAIWAFTASWEFRGIAVVVLAWCGFNLFGKWRASRLESPEHVDAELRELDKELAALSCEMSPHGAPVRPVRRTARLVFQETKSAVCKPYSD